MASFSLWLHFTDIVIVTFAVDCIVQEVPTNYYDVINLLGTDNYRISFCVPIGRLFAAGTQQPPTFPPSFGS